MNLAASALPFVRKCDTPSPFSLFCLLMHSTPKKVAPPLLLAFPCSPPWTAGHFGCCQAFFRCHKDVLPRYPPVLRLLYLNSPASSGTCHCQALSLCLKTKIQQRIMPEHFCILYHCHPPSPRPHLDVYEFQDLYLICPDLLVQDDPCFFCPLNTCYLATTGLNDRLCMVEAEPPS